MVKVEEQTRRFKAALAMAGLTMAEFGALHGVSKQHVSEVSRGRDVSAKVSAAIDRLIAEYAPKRNRRTA